MVTLLGGGFVSDILFGGNCGVCSEIFHTSKGRGRTESSGIDERNVLGKFKSFECFALESLSYLLVGCDTN